ncbi:hypothetical protein BS47DRAFT_661134 [Hydnum rufescens UP504]|uniref:Uncharacterized protein n=1 Tax=Hydnum rufescens UP504 TaxID=1448309 RepID=A0A9P6AFC2_9AGAM|nr:hypothetical protein BS47DRAFT_661134 [Hydnum rufescens UP504]
MPISRGPFRGFYLRTPLVALISVVLSAFCSNILDPPMIPAQDGTHLFFPTSNVSSRSGILPLRGPLPIHFRHPFCNDNSQIPGGLPGEPQGTSGRDVAEAFTFSEFILRDLVQWDISSHPSVRIAYSHSSKR